MENQTHDDDTLLTRQEAAQFLGVKSGTLSAWAGNHRYDLPMIKLGKKVQYKLSDLKAFTKKRRILSKEVYVDPLASQNLLSALEALTEQLKILNKNVSCVFQETKREIPPEHLHTL